MSTTVLEGIHVLHVDDNPDLGDLTATFLERDDDRFTVETATGAGEALEMVSDHPPDCIVSDYNMPGMDGLEFLEAVRAEYPDLPFVLFTGKGSEEVASDAISAGATDYLQKQSGAEQYQLLANRITNAVRQYRSEEKLRETREEYTAVFENAQDGLLLVAVEDDGFRYRQCNPRVVELLGRDTSEIVGATPREALGPENARKVVEPYRTCVERRESVEYTVTLDLPMGRVTRECKASPVTSAGEVDQLVVAFHDITERRERQQELRAERRFIGQALDTLEDLFYVLDVDGHLRRWNDRVPEVTGYAESELDGMPIDELFPEDEWEAIAAELEATLSEEDTTAEAPLLGAEGGRTPFEFTAARLTDEDGTTTGIVGVGRDLTERRQREQRFRALVEESSDVISIVDANGQFRYQSPSLERILGHDPEETIGDTAWEYIHPEDRGSVANAFEEWVENPEATYPIEYRASHADGSWRWMEAHGTDQLENPAVEGYVINSRDITDRKQRERETEVVRRQYRTLVEQFPNGAVFLFDDDLRFVRAGGEELTVVGLTPDEVEGATPQDLFPAEIADETVRHYREALRGNAHTFEQDYGGERYQIQTVPVRTADGEIAYGMAVSRNVTEETERRRELERQNERLDEFASIVSHDLRNPLNVAEGHLELARETCDSEHLDLTSDAIDRSLTLIEDLLTLAREDREVGDVEPVALGEVAERSWQTAETGAATLETEATRTIRADDGRLRQLLENLYRNAVEHASTGGGPEADGTVGRRREDVTVVVGETEGGFYVADDGPGIAEADRGEVFDAGYSTIQGGTGLGLRIVEEVADAHGWEVTLTDGERGGARFEVTGVDTAD